MSLIGAVRPGDTVFFFNQWTGFENNEIRGCFERFKNEADAKKIKSGDIIWVDREPYSAHGKVYGFTCLVVERVEEAEGSNRIFYGSGSRSSSSFYSNFARVTDEAKLAELIAQHPKALQHPIG